MAAELHLFKRIWQSIGLGLGASNGPILLPEAPQIMLVQWSLRFHISPPTKPRSRSGARRLGGVPGVFSAPPVREGFTSRRPDAAGEVDFLRALIYRQVCSYWLK